MLGRLVACALLVASSDALKVCPALTRRGLVTKAIAASVTLSPLASGAELKQASDGPVYKRADDGELNTARVIERAKTGELVEGASASCSQLERLIAIDRQAAQFEVAKLKELKLDKSKDARDQEQIVRETEAKIEVQVKKLESLKAGKKCLEDESIYKRADEGKLNAARVIERAKAGDLVSGEGATCKELDAIIQIDKDAIEFERDKLEALEYYGTGQGEKETQLKIVADAEKAIETQVEKLLGFKATCK